MVPRVALGAAALLCFLPVRPVPACSGVAVARDAAVVVGVNEDNSLNGASLWATPATEGRYGALYFGFFFHDLGNRRQTWYEMQGVNDRGLFFDLFSVPAAPGRTPSQPPPVDRPPGYPPPEDIERTMMETCATVQEALAFLHARSYARVLPEVQVLLVDRSGAAAVYTDSGDVFRRDSVFVVTNFNLAAPSRGGYPCERYSLARRMLLGDDSPTAANVGRILRAVRHLPRPGDEGGTRYSLVCDLVNGTMDVYVFGDFSRSARLDLAGYWATGQLRMQLTELDFGPSGL